MTIDFGDAIESARAVLRANDRGGYTVPTDGLYPFQWNWDSAFSAVGIATYDIDRAWTEFDSLLTGQWPDGMVPHIVFHRPADSYFPGPEVWGTTHVPATSGITQPPIAAVCVRWIVERAADPAAALAAAAQRLDALDRWHRWWWRARDPDGTGAVAILHPWESGMDNSPAWDAALARVPPSTTPFTRRDTGHVDAAMRPRDAEYARYLLLVETYRDAGWQPHAQWRASPFRVADVSVNAILIRAETDLAWLATKAGRPDLAAPIEARLVRARAAMAASWDGSASRFLSRDLIANLPIGAATSAGFLPLLTDVPTAAQVDAMATEIDRWRNGAGFGLATVPVADPAFDGRRYWRGPIWPMVNWMLADGLARHGAGSLAAALKGDIGRLLRHGGFAEYFDPRDGAPCGGGRFSWTAATGLAFAFTDD